MHGKRQKSGKTIGHSLRPVFGWSEIGGMLIAAASAVKASWRSIAYWKRGCFGMPRSRNNRFALVLRQFALVFRRAIGGGGFSATDAHPVQRQPHALGRHRRPLRTERARI